MVYDINGNEVGNSFVPSASLQTGIHENTFYYFLRIMKKKPDGTSQFPFVMAANGNSATDKSALDFALDNDFLLVTNSGLGNQSGQSWVPLGKLVENGRVIADNSTSYGVLVIDGNGNLSVGEAGTSAADLIEGGAVSVLTAFGPIIVDYEPTAKEDYPNSNNWEQYAQRQIIGQFANGDYAIITCEGRDYDNSVGWTIPQAQALCQQLNLKFAFNLDGGGSTETVVGKKQLNTIYENATGRTVCSFIVFNGTDAYVARNE